MNNLPMNSLPRTVFKLCALSILAVSICACTVVPREKGYKNRAALPVMALERCVPSTTHLPKFLSGKSPIYPIRRLMARQEGTSKVSLVVSKEGRVKNVKDIESTHSAFFNHTAAAADNWLFQPAKNGEEVVEVQCRFKVTYGLR